MTRGAQVQGPRMCYARFGGRERATNPIFAQQVRVAARFPLVGAFLRAVLRAGIFYL
jgi:hypothetical protein